LDEIVASAWEWMQAHPQLYAEPAGARRS
jgi:hypothetical protein